MTQKSRKVAKIKDAGALVADEALQEMALAMRDDNEMRGGGNTIYINFSGKTGVYSVGQNKDPMDDTADFIINPLSWQVGFACWKGNQIVERVLKPYMRQSELPAANAEEMEETNSHGPYRQDGDGWKDSWQFDCMSPGDPDVQFVFNTTSTSGCNSVKDTAKTNMKRVTDGEAGHYAVIRFKEEEFTAQGQVNWKPIFEIQGWLDKAAMAQVIAGEATIDEVMEEYVPVIQKIMPAQSGGSGGASKAKKAPARKSRR